MDELLLKYPVPLVVLKHGFQTPVDVPQVVEQAGPGPLLLLATGPVYVGLLLAYGANPTTLNVGYAPIQPVPYSHALHVGKLGMDCRYCHNTVEKSGMAALPPTETCMNCHTAIFPNRRSWPRFARATPRHADSLGQSARHRRLCLFQPHAHVNAGVGCAECHGRVDQMEVVQTVKPLNMGWCLDCHRDPGSRCVRKTR